MAWRFNIFTGTLDYYESAAAVAAHAGTHVTGGGDTVADAIAAGNSGLMSGADKTKLDGIEALADVTGTNAPQAHAASHTDGTDDIQSATNTQKGVATAAQIIALELATAIENYADSPMVVTGGTISEGTTGTFTVSALTALLRTTDSLTGSLAYVTLAEQSNQVITSANVVYHVCLDYNGGTPQIVISTTNPYTRASSPDRTQIPIGIVMKDSGDDVHFISGGFSFQDGVRKLHMRARELRGYELASGSAIAYSGTNNFTMEAGVAYDGLNKFTLASYNSATTQFSTIYSDGGAGWTEALSNVIDYAHYDDGDGTLGNVGVAKYGVFWVYRHLDDGHVYVRYGTSGSYTLAAAEASPVPTACACLTSFGLLIGKIVAPQSGGSFILVQMVTDKIFTAVSASDHGSLSGLLDDDHTQYIKDTEFTQDSGVLVGTGAGTFAEETGDTLRTSLGLSNIRVVVVKVIADTTALTTGDGKAYFTVPIELNGMNLVSVGAHVYTVSSSGLPTFQIHNLTQTADMLSTAITIDENEKDSKDATTAAVIDAGNDDVATGDELRFDCDTAGTGTKGCEIRMGFQTP